MQYGIVNQKAPEINIDYWIDENGKQTSALKLKDFNTQFKLFYCFQSWCPGCHKYGFPSLQNMVNALSGYKDISFAVIQTVFEGFEQNTVSKLAETQSKYDLKIPFAHDAEHYVNGQTMPSSSMMKDYYSGGTPWFVLIDTDTVIFNDFHIDDKKLIEYFEKHLTVV